jgi:hypothetical protein
MLCFPPDGKDRGRGKERGEVVVRAKGIGKHAGSLPSNTSAVWCAITAWRRRSAKVRSMSSEAAPRLAPHAPQRSASLGLEPGRG